MNTKKTWQIAAFWTALLAVIVFTGCQFDGKSPLRVKGDFDISLQPETAASPTTAKPSATAPVSPTVSATQAPTATVPVTATKPVTGTVAPTATVTPTAQPTRTVTPTATVSPTVSATSTPTATATVTATKPVVTTAPTTKVPAQIILANGQVITVMVDLPTMVAPAPATSPTVTSTATVTPTTAPTATVPLGPTTAAALTTAFTASVSVSVCRLDKVATFAEVGNAGPQRIEAGGGGIQHIDFYPNRGVKSVSYIVPRRAPSVWMGFGSIWEAPNSPECSSFDFVADATNYARGRLASGHSGLVVDIRGPTPTVVANVANMPQSTIDALLAIHRASQQ